MMSIFSNSFLAACNPLYSSFHFTLTLSIISYSHIPHSHKPLHKRAPQMLLVFPKQPPPVVSQHNARILTPWVFEVLTNCWVVLHWLHPGWRMQGRRGPPHCLSPPCTAVNVTSSWMFCLVKSRQNKWIHDDMWGVRILDLSWQS